MSIPATLSARPVPRDGLAAAEDQALELLLTNLDQVGAFRSQAEQALAVMDGLNAYLTWADDRMTALALLLNGQRSTIVQLSRHLRARQERDPAPIRMDLARQRAREAIDLEGADAGAALAAAELERLYGAAAGAAPAVGGEHGQ